MNVEPSATVPRAQSFSPKVVAGARAAIAVVGPLVLLAGFLYHPVLPELTEEAIGAAVEADQSRWAVSHLLVAVGFGLTAVSFLALRGHLRDAGEERWSAVGLPFVVLASVLFAMLPALELGMLAASQTGGDPALVQAALQTYFPGIMLAGSVLFGVGALAFAIAVVKSRTLGRATAWVVAIALVLMAVARGPSSFTFYVWGGAGVAAFWPLAWAMWARGAERRAGASSRAVRSTT